jgi:CubicO group peptidase (beta-lactamase class C family)
MDDWKTFLRKLLLAVTLPAILCLAGCTTDPHQSMIYRQPDDMADGLDVGTMNEVNLDAALLTKAASDISGGRYGEVHSLLVYKDSKLVFEEYFPGHDYSWSSPDFHGSWVDWGVDRRHNIHSVGKSITSACVGIAVDRGFIESVDQSIFDYLPTYQYLNTAGKANITIAHLLSMTSGLEWDEWDSSYANENNDVIALWVDCDDPIACILERPLVAEPGTVFNYSGGNMVLLGEIIRNASGMDIGTFSQQYLFTPLGIEEPAWQWIGDSEVIYAGGDQRLTPREMLKFGVVYLNHGVWQDKQIIPAEWVEQSAAPYPGPGNTWFNHFLRPIPPDDGSLGPRGYAYSWWVHEFSYGGEKFPAYWAGGWGGQTIKILPDHHVVIVLTGANYNEMDPTVKILKKYIIPAIDK